MPIKIPHVNFKFNFAIHSHMLFARATNRNESSVSSELNTSTDNNTHYLIYTKTNMFQVLEWLTGFINCRQVLEHVSRFLAHLNDCNRQHIGCSEWCHHSHSRKHATLYVSWMEFWAECKTRDDKENLTSQSGHGESDISLFLLDACRFFGWMNAQPS